jgi:hypothetical protein
MLSGKETFKVALLQMGGYGSHDKQTPLSLFPLLVLSSFTVNWLASINKLYVAIVNSDMYSQNPNIA